MKTTTEIVEETVAYYSEDVSRRASTIGGCQYKTNDGRMCAVGRCLTEEGLQSAGNMGTRASALAEQVCAYTLDSILKPEYRGHELEFWDQLQALHDYDRYWGKDGLNEEGRKAASVL